MRLFLFIFYFSLYTIPLFAQDYQWTKSFGSVNVDEAHGICTDTSGNIITTGYYRNTVDFDPGTGVSNFNSAGGIDIYILKLDANGNFDWVKTIGSSVNEFATSVATDDDGNIYVFGGYTGGMDFDPGVAADFHVAYGGYDCFLMKLDANGNYLWTRTFGGSGIESSRSVYLKNGFIYLAGSFESTSMDFDPGTATDVHNSYGLLDAFIMKLDLSGNFIWAQTYGGTGSDEATSLISDGNGIFVTGYFETDVDFDPGNGITNMTSNGLGDAYFLKLVLTGNFAMVKTTGSIANDRGNDIDSDATGNIYLTGEYNGEADFDPGTGVDLHAPDTLSKGSYIQKFDNSGNYLWSKTLSSAGNIQSLSIFCMLGYIYSSGYFQGTMDFDPASGIDNHSTSSPASVFLQKYNASGDMISTKTLTGSGLVYEISGDLNGNLFLCGRFSGGYDFNPEVSVDFYTSNGLLDAFICKYNDIQTNLTELISDASVKIFPNPANELFNLSISNIPQGDYKLNIFNADAKIVYSETLINIVGNFNYEIDLGKYSDGLYYLQVDNGINFYTGKIITNSKR